MEHHDDCRKTQQRSPRLHYPSLVLYLILNLFAATMEPIVAASMLIWIIITRHMNYALVFPTKPSFSSMLPFTTHFQTITIKRSDGICPVVGKIGILQWSDGSRVYDVLHVHEHDNWMQTGRTRRAIVCQKGFQKAWISRIYLITFHNMHMLEKRAEQT